MIRKNSMYLLAALMLVFSPMTACADETEAVAEPEENYDTGIQSIHIGQTHVWKPLRGAGQITPG